MPQKIIPLVLKCFDIIPWNLLDLIAQGLANLFYPFLSRRRKIAMANLNLVFNERLSSNQKETILKTNLYYFIRNILEIGKIMNLEPETWLQKWKIKGEENLKAAYMKGRGAIIVSAHVGNFPLMVSILALRGYDIAVVAKVPQRGIGGKAINLFERRFGLKFIHARENKKAAILCARHLKKGGMLFIQFDQNAPKHKALIPFFGYRVPVPRSPAVLAQRTGASIIPVFALCQKGFRHQVVCESEIKIDKLEIEEILGEIMKVMEKYAFKYPEQWFWWHRRFKGHIDYANL